MSGPSNGFEEVKLVWGDDTYIIAPDRVMGALFRIEQVITITELSAAVNTGNVPLVRVSRAFAEVLRYAGADVTDEQVYASMFKKVSSQLAAMRAVQTLMSLMIPPSEILNDIKPEGDVKPKKSKASSKQHGKLQ